MVMRRKQLQTAKLSNMLHLIRRTPSGTVELLTLLLLMPLPHNATATPAVDITLHQQGILMVQENGTAAVVCEVQYSSALLHRFFTTFTWNGFPLQSGHPHLVSGLLNVVADDCNQRYEGRVCEQFIMTIRGLSIANDSTIGCYSRDLSTFETVIAVGHVQVMLTPAPPPATQSATEVPTASTQLPTPTVTTTVHPTPVTSMPVTSVLVTTSATPASSGFPTPLHTPDAGSTTQAVRMSVLLVASLQLVAACLYY